MYSMAFLRDLVERVIRTAAATLLGLLAADTVASLDYKAAGVAIGTACLVTALACVLATGLGTKGTASATSDVVYKP